jgi:hypothetical protein
MLGVLGVGDGFEQQAIISIPCSAADLTADRELGLDDVQAFVDRFTSGHPLADLNDDGLLGLADVLRFVELYRAGCPD